MIEEEIRGYRNTHPFTCMCCMEFSGLELAAQLVSELSTSTKTNDKLQSLVDYFLKLTCVGVGLIAILAERPKAYW